MIALNKLSETSSTITLGWSPPSGVAGYVLFANDQVVSVATKNLKDGTPRNSAKFSKMNPGPPYEVAAVCRTTTVSVDIGVYPQAQSDLYPSAAVYPSEVHP